MAFPFEPTGNGPEQHNWDLLNQQHPFGPEDLRNSAVTDTKLASPNNSVYRTLLATNGAFGGGAATGTYVFAESGAFVQGGTNITSAMQLVYLDDADHTVAGKSTKLRVKAQVLTNATAPGATFTFGLHPITATAGGSGGLTYTVGAAESGSTAAIATPALSTRNHAEGTDFAFPADGYYVLAVVTSGSATAANSFEMVSAQLQIRHT